jgi:hypothetical protein
MSIYIGNLTYSVSKWAWIDNQIRRIYPKKPYQSNDICRSIAAQVKLDWLEILSSIQGKSPGHELRPIIFDWLSSPLVAVGRYSPLRNDQ